MAARATEAGRQGRARALRSRAGRTLVALLGVGSLALTAAAAQPLGPLDRTLPADVFAAGADGLGPIDLTSPAGSDVTSSRTGRTRAGSAATGEDDELGSTSLPGADGAIEVPGAGFGEESLASIVPAGLGGGAGIPAPTLRAYRAAAGVLARETPGCGIDWALLAGIGRVESDHGRFGGATVTDQGVSVPRILGPRLDGSLAGTQVIRDSDGGTLDGDAAYDRAVGPMQFLPGTWTRWGSDGDRDGTSDPQDIDDAALAAARYLCEGRTGLAEPAQASLAVRRYNNSASYVDLVLATAEGYRSGEGLDVGGADPFGDGGGFDPFSDDRGFSPFAPGGPPPPGWNLPPGTVVGAGPVVTPAGPSPAPSVSVPPAAEPTALPVPSAAPSTAPPSGGPTSPPATPTSPPSSPSQDPGEPTGTPTSSPTGTPTTDPPTPTDEPTTATPSPSETTPTCDPDPTPTTGPTASGPTGDPSLGPCPVPCGTVPPTTAPPQTPTDPPSCLPVPPTGSPAP